MNVESSRYHAYKRLDILGLLLLIAGFVWEFGWPLTQKQYGMLLAYFFASTILHLIGAIGSFVHDTSETRRPRLLLFQIVGCLTIISLLFWEDGLRTSAEINRVEVIRMLSIIALVAVPILMSLTHLFQWLIRQEDGGRFGIPPALQFVLSMVGVISVGTGFLMMPNSLNTGIRFVDAFFTSTSAVAVTGLCPVDFYSVFSLKGQIIVLCLMQIGGFGVMTFAYFIAMIAGQGLSLRDRILFRDLLDDNNMSRAVSFVRNIVIMTFGIEAVGFVLLYLSWDGALIDLGGRPVWWHAMFHSVSGFCNAGFSSLPQGGLSPDFVMNKAGQAVIMGLVIAGGLGFSVYFEIKCNISEWYRHRIRGMRPHITWTPYFKLVVFTTITLIAGGAAVLFFIGHSSGELMGAEDRAWQCLYDSIICRTCGLGSSDMSAYMPSALLIICALMAIGGSPGGTAGGVRTTSAAVAAGEVWRALRGRKDVQFFHRKIAPDVIDRCMVTIAVAGAWMGGMTVLTCYFDPDLNPLFLFFENCSAFSTTGLSCGITGLLSDPSKYILIVSMIAGRAGLFLFLVALAGRPKKLYLHYPTVRIPLT